MFRKLLEIMAYYNFLIKEIHDKTIFNFYRAKPYNIYYCIYYEIVPIFVSRETFILFYYYHLRVYYIRLTIS